MAIITEQVIINGVNLIKTYSDEDKYIIQNGTLYEYESAIDMINRNITYTESSKYIPQHDNTLAEREAIKTLLNVEELTDEEADTEINNFHEIKRQEDLISIPTPGEIWRKNANYIAGDYVVDPADELEYDALKYSKNKRPSISPIHWRLRVSTPVYENWDDLADGTVIEKNIIVTHNGINWKCKTQHIKSSVYEPKTGSSRWEVVS